MLNCTARLNCSLSVDGSVLGATGEGDGGVGMGVTVAAAVVLGIIAVLSTIGNVMVLYVIFKHLQFKTVTNTFITSMSVSDLLSALGCMPLALVTLIRGDWVFGAAGCAVQGTATAALGVVSTAMLAYITVDRYFVLVKLPRRPVTVTSALLAIGATWCAALAVSAPWYLLVPRNATEGWGPHRAGYTHCMYVLHVMHSNYPGPAFSSLYVLLCYVTPAAGMLFCAASLWRILHHSDSRVRPSSTPVTQLRFNGEMRTAKTVVVMVILYMLTRMPYVLAGLVCAMLGRPLSPTLDTTLMWLFWANCAMNPVVYAFRNPTVAQLLHLQGRQAGYEAESPASTGPHHLHTPCSIASRRGIADEFLTPRQCKYLPSASGVQAAVDIADIADTCAGMGTLAGAEGRDGRSDSIPSVLLFKAAAASLRKGSGFSTITSSTNTTTM